MTNDPFEIVIIDADSICYEIACVSNNYKSNARSLESKLNNIITDTEAQQGIVYIKGTNNFRHQCTTDYKANRKDNLTDEQRVSLARLYEDAKEFCFSSDDGEADDYCAIMAKEYRDSGRSFVISHIDKDLNGLEGVHHNFRKNTYYSTSKEASYRFMMKQFLTGDAADNIKGLWRIGPVSADKLLNDVPVEKLWDTVITIWKEKQGNEWRNNFIRCVNLIYIRDRMEDLRPLSFEELGERLVWNTSTDTGTVLPQDLKEHLRSCISSPTESQDADMLEGNNSEAAVAS